MLQKTTGIVLRTQKFKDTQLISVVYTELYGRTALLVPVSRSRKTKVHAGLFQPFSIVDIEADFKPNKSFSHIKDAKSAYPFTSIPFSPQKSAIALFLSDFLYKAIQEEAENKSLFSFLLTAIKWLDVSVEDYANYHLVFLMHLSRFLGFYPYLDNYQEGDYFDLLNACFVPSKPTTHTSFIQPDEAAALRQLMRMNFETMYLFKFNRVIRQRCLVILNEYYRLHIPGFPELNSLRILKELFD